MNSLSTKGLLIPALTISATLSAMIVEAKERPQQNVLFIIIDDLRPELGCYGHDVVSPNIDALAESGVQFRNSYCNIPVSGASRACLMSGTRPTRNTFLNAYASLTHDKPDMVGINKHFSENGYKTIVEGKVFHFVPDHDNEWDKRISNSADAYALEENKLIMKEGGRGPSYECADVPDDTYLDGRAATLAMAELEELAESKEPFFFALGIAKPHLPFVSPKSYWDLYDRDEIVLPENFVVEEGHDIPAMMFHKFGELRNYSDVGADEVISEEKARTLIHGYRASVSYIDAQIGKVLDKLEELGLDENTAVVLLGDHGWNLGDHGMWCKHTLFDHATNAPIIIRDPASKLKGYISEEIVEYVDMFPTMCELAGIPSHEQNEGASVVPLLSSKRAKHKGYAISRWSNGFKITRQDGFAYIEWWDEDDSVIERALFNHNVDPMENKNIVNDPQYAELVEELSAELMASRGENFDKYPKKPLTNDPFNIK